MILKYASDEAGEERQNKQRIFIGRIVHSKSLTELEIYRCGAIGIDSDGSIKFVHEYGGLPSVLHPALHEMHASVGFASAEYIYLKPSQFLFPGMIDTHLHAPQWPNLALGMEGNLREWVENWTDPMEASAME